jgi:hypothetical protein
MKILAIVISVVCFVLAALYLTGHGPGAGHEVHVKHGVIFIVLGLLSLVWMRFQNSSAAVQ